MEQMSNVLFEHRIKAIDIVAARRTNERQDVFVSERMHDSCDTVASSEHIPYERRGELRQSGVVTRNASTHNIDGFVAYVSQTHLP